MKNLILKIVCSIAALISWGVMGVEIFANGMNNLTLIEVCAWIMMVCLVGLLASAIVDLVKGKK